MSAQRSYRLECDFLRAGQWYKAGDVIDDLSAADVRDLGGMAVPVKGKDKPKPKPSKRWSDAERATICERIDEAVQGGADVKAAIKALKQADPELPAESTLRKWMTAWRASAAQSGGEDA